MVSREHFALALVGRRAAVFVAAADLAGADASVQAAEVQNLPLVAHHSMLNACLCLYRCPCLGRFLCPDLGRRSYWHPNRRFDGHYHFAGVNARQCDDCHPCPYEALIAYCEAVAIQWPKERVWPGQSWICPGVWRPTPWYHHQWGRLVVADGCVQNKASCPEHHVGPCAGFHRFVRPLAAD